MNNADKAYLELLKEVRENGVIKSDRTGTGTISIFGRSLKFKMSEGFPLLTTKKIHTKSVIHELLWFLDGGHNIKYLVDNGVNIWNEWPWQNYMKEHENRKLQLTVSMKNADSYIGTAFEVSHMKQRLDEHPALTLEEFITKIKDSEISGKYSASKDSFADVWGELGPVYGKQWRQWQGWVQYEKTDGDYNGVGFGSVWHDQILKLIQDLKTNPDSRRLMVNAWNVAEIDSMLLPPCFLKDSYVCTKDAYKKIQDITMDDYILSHDGSFNKVDEIFKTEYSGDMLKIKPYYIPAFECTPNHPFLVKDKGYIEASKLSVSDFIGIPINTKSIIPEFEFIDYKTPFGINKNTVNKKILLDNLDYWYFMGYYLGDGWLNFKKREVFLSIANKDKIKVLPKLLNCFKLYEHRSSGINVKKYSAKNELFFNLLQEFGQYCDGKKIPEWVQDAPLEMINSFLEGYKDADGCEDHISIHVTTVSDSIAYSVQRLYLKLKKKCSISYSIKDKKRLLLGRLVNQKNSYLLTVQKDYKYTNNNFIFD
jgi:thymidylate synthase